MLRYYYTDMIEMSLLGILIQKVLLGRLDFFISVLEETGRS